MFYFEELIPTQIPLYLFNWIPANLKSLRHPNIQLLDTETIILKILLHLIVREWNKPSTEISFIKQLALQCFLFITHFVSTASHVETWFYPFA